MGCDRLENSIFKALETEASRADVSEPEHEIRNAFQRDRDRILYSKEFRRLSGKTQVFIAGFDDHMRTRLTHTLEVSQIADTIARAVGLNELLVEAISYGHDVGHTPFGHVGERTLNLIMNGCKEIYKFNADLNNSEKGFKHNFQSYRVMTELEELYGKGYGLNLTKFTLWGVLNHSSKRYKDCEFFGADKKCKLQNRNTECLFNGKHSLDFYKNNHLKDSLNWTIEAAVVSIADEIAQRHHDIEDGFHAGLLEKDEIIELFENTFDGFKGDKENEIINKLKESDSKSKRINISLISKLIVDFYTLRYIKHLETILEEIREKFRLETQEEFHSKKVEIYDYLLYKNNETDIIKCLGFETEFLGKDKIFQSYLFNKILYSELAQSMDGKADFIIRQLFKAYLSNPQQLPDKTIKTIRMNYEKENEFSNNVEISDRTFLREKLNCPDEGNRIHKIVLRVTCDFIAGMTDNYAVDQFEKLYGSKKYTNY